MSSRDLSDGGSGEGRAADDMRKRVVFALRNLWYLRPLASTIETILARGHSVTICAYEQAGSDAEHGPLASSQRTLQQILDAYPETAAFKVLQPWRTGWGVVDLAVARLIDHFHLRGKLFVGKRTLAARASLPSPLRQIFGIGMLRIPWLAELLTRRFMALERRLPGNPDFGDLLEAERPHAVVLSPLIDLGFSQYGDLRAARQSGVPTVFVVNSWDNLSSKSRVRDQLDRMTVWNELQRDEAVKFHSFDPASVSVTGAPGFDVVFDYSPTMTPDAFMASIGLPSDRPMVLYAASAMFARDRQAELDFVQEWIDALRASDDPVLAGVSVILRPHPKRYEIWMDAQLRLHGPTVIWPRAAENPADVTTRENYLNSIAHSCAVVGLNTSAFLDAAALGRPALTVLDRKYRRSQRSTFHFAYITGRHTGFVRSAPSLGDHLNQLRQAIENPNSTAVERDRVLAFLRPAGADKAATEILADTIIQAASETRTPPKQRWGDIAIRCLLWPLAMLAGALYRYRARRRAAATRAS